MTTMDEFSREEPGTATRPYLSFLSLTAGIVVALLAIGLIPTRRLAGDEAVTAMLAGCAISFAAALLGTVPVILARGQAAPATVPAVMASIAVRLGAVIVLGVAAAWSGWFETVPLLIWLVLSHAALQVADIRFTRQVLYQS